MIQAMDDQRTGRIFREVRIKRGWRQVDLASAARSTQSVVSDLERGRLEEISLATLRRIGRALDIRVGIHSWWRGGEVDRLLDRGHASLVEYVVRAPNTAGWETDVEVGFNLRGERGSVDVIGWHAVARILVIAEVKTRIGDVQELLAVFGRKVRIVPDWLEERRDWKPDRVVRLLVMPENRRDRSVVEAHRASSDVVWPDRTSAMRRLIRSPLARPEAPGSGRGPVDGGILFVSIDALGAASGVRLTERVRRRPRRGAIVREHVSR
jgi:transcriptional regulator with XRE-family HTH domain